MMASGWIRQLVFWRDNRPTGHRRREMYVTKIHNREFEHHTIQAAANSIAIQTHNYAVRVSNMRQLRDFAKRCGLDPVANVWVRNS